MDTTAGEIAENDCTVTCTNILVSPGHYGRHAGDVPLWGVEPQDTDAVEWLQAKLRWDRNKVMLAHKPSTYMGIARKNTGLGPASHQ